MKKIVGVILENNPKTYFFLTSEEKYRRGAFVLVETDMGLQLGKIATPVKVYDEEHVSASMKTVVRVANKKDLLQHQRNLKESSAALKDAKSIAEDLHLAMRFLDANYTFDRKQLFFSYIADTRIDFRVLAKRLASKYKTRIELRQIGVRDKAKKIGGVGPCGLKLCCNQFLVDFVPVSINMAKNQDLALNPSKINGLCGRLLCCLNYEDELYKELREKMPEIGAIVKTTSGIGKVISVDLFHQNYQVKLENKEIVLESVH